MNKLLPFSTIVLLLISLFNHSAIANFAGGQGTEIRSSFSVGKVKAASGQTARSVGGLLGSGPVQ